MSAVDMAVAAVFADENIARDVIYRANGVSPGATIRAMHAAADDSADFFDTKAKVTGRRLDIMASDVPAPTKSDLVDIDGTIFKVADIKADKRRVIWKLVLKES